MSDRFAGGLVRLLLAIGVSISLSACTVGTARVNQFDKFAQGGIAYCRTDHALYHLIAFPLRRRAPH
ncbi:MAG: hypothetical protein L0Y67_01420 [Gammaproteobacteria bacterium]|nr:hypothetical protein [Gammaproteobacteria bacterium]MCI0590262.1 hypothetical protein [Gammaproteobacteria bacterium]